MYTARLTLAALAVFPSACTTLQNQARVDPSVVAFYSEAGSNRPATVDPTTCISSPLPGDTRGGALDLGCFTLPGDTAVAFKLAKTDAQVRNALSSVLINNSNVICNIELGRLTGNEAMLNTGLSGAATAATTIGSFVADTGRKVALAVAGAMNATRDNFNVNTYRNVLSSAVVGAILRERSTFLGQIEAKRGQPVSQYSREDVLTDVNEYHQICSFYRGLQLVIHANERPAFEAADIRGSATAMLATLDARAEVINSKLKQTGMSAEERANLTTQLAQIRTTQNLLIQQMGTVTRPPSPSPPPTTDTSNPPPQPPTGSDTDKPQPAAKPGVKK